MTENQFPDPFSEAASNATRALMRDAAAVVALARVFLQIQARARQRKMIKNEREKKALEAREKAEREATRARWAPAADRQWLRSADPVELAEVWGAAVPYADPDSDLYERSAELAVDNCESRLRELHPYAMNHYDRLRTDGISRSEAMLEAAPLFLNHPYARPHSGSDRPAIAVQGHGDPWIDQGHGPSREGFEQHVARQQIARGTRALENLQAWARAEGRPPLDLEEQRVALEQATNLPPEIIGQIVPSSRPRPVQRRPWENESPFTIEEVVAIAARHPESLVSPVPAPSSAPAQARQQGRAPHA